jgi:hypothetical protein
MATAAQLSLDVIDKDQIKSVKFNFLLIILKVRLGMRKISGGSKAHY